MDDLKTILWWLFGIIVVFYLSVNLREIWGEADRAGWIRHHLATKIFHPESKPWEVGEYLECAAVLQPPKTHKQQSVGIDYLSCARTLDWDKEGVQFIQQEMQVTYWGRVEVSQPEAEQIQNYLFTVPFDKWKFRWHCRRNASDVTCWATS